MTHGTRSLWWLKLFMACDFSTYKAETEAGCGQTRLPLTNLSKATVFGRTNLRRVVFDDSLSS
jgi:hypothetical protein